jgi:sortase A
MTGRTRIAAWWLDATAVVLALAFICLAGRSLLIYGKGILADHLISRAFAAHIRDGGDHPPWNWADVIPVAILDVPRLGIHRHILSGATGSSMAFGVGHLHGTSLPNTKGNCVLAGHRDTRFAFLEELEVGDEVILTTRGVVRAWRVQAVAVVDDSHIGILESNASNELTLVTCFPFRSYLPSAQRFIVRCLPVGEQDEGA